MVSVSVIVLTPICWVLHLGLVQVIGVSGQQWKVILTHYQICAVRGSTVVMPCSFTRPRGLGITEVFWTRNPQPEAERTDMSDDPDYKGRVLYSADVSKNCTATLKDVRLADTGIYHPRIVTVEDTQKWLGQPGLKLSVTDLSVWIPRPVIEGSDVKMNCNSSCGSEDKPTVIWRKNRADVPGEQTKNTKLILHNVSPKDEGYYSCALKGYERYPATAVKLSVMFPPRNIKLSINPTNRMPKGSSVTLTCNSVANPPVENYKWFKVNESTPVGSGQQYSITNISSEDGGQYYCEARNKHGAENSTAVSITVEEDKTLMFYIMIGVSSGCGFLCLLCIVCFIRVLCKTKENLDTGQPSEDNMKTEESDKMDSNDYEDCIDYENVGADMDSVYQNVNENDHVDDNDDHYIYQNM